MKDSDEFKELAYIIASNYYDETSGNFTTLSCDISNALLAVHNRAITRERDLLDRIEKPLKKELGFLKSCFEGLMEVVLHRNDLDWKAIDEALSIIEKARNNDHR